MIQNIIHNKKQKGQVTPKLERSMVSIFILQSWFLEAPRVLQADGELKNAHHQFHWQIFVYATAKRPLFDFAYKVSGFLAEAQMFKLLQSYKIGIFMWLVNKKLTTHFTMHITSDS